MQSSNDNDRDTLFTRRDALGLIGIGTLAGLSGSLPFSPVHARAPMLGVPKTAFRRFSLGEFEVTIIRDGSKVISSPFAAFAADQFEEDVHELLKANLLPVNRFELPYAPVVVNTREQLILFDSGNGPARRPNSGHLVAGLAAAGYAPDQVDMVVITHCHPDHVGGLLEDGKRTFPNARYICGGMEYDFWSNKSLLDGDPSIARRAKVVQANVVSLAPRTTFIKNDGEVVSGIRAVFTPGHTPGHLAYHVESKGKRMLIWGDAVVHFVISFQQPVWPLASDMDQEQAGATRRTLLDMAAADKILVTGYHLPFPAIGYVEKYKGAYRFVPASYQLNL